MGLKISEWEISKSNPNKTEALLRLKVLHLNRKVWKSCYLKRLENIHLWRETSKILWLVPQGTRWISLEHRRKIQTGWIILNQYQLTMEAVEDPRMTHWSWNNNWISSFILVFQGQSKKVEVFWSIRILIFSMVQANIDFQVITLSELMQDLSLDKMFWIIIPKTKQMLPKWTKTWTLAVISRFQQSHNLSIKWDKVKRKFIGIQTYQAKKHCRILIQIREQLSFIKTPQIILPGSQQEMPKIELTAKCKQIMLSKLWLEPITVHSMEVQKHR